MIFVTVKRKKLLAATALIVCAAAVALTLLGGGVSAAFNANAKLLPVYRVETDEKKVAISFDCAWGVEFTDKLLEIMDEKNVKCTFFSVEFWTERYPDYVKKIDAHGHEIGTHSASHPYMSRLSKETVIRELTSSSEAITALTGKKVELFRPPYGDYNDNLIQTAQELGLFVIQWDVDSLDWKDLSAADIAERVLKRVKNGSIVLFHNNALHTAEALPQIIDSLKGDGFEFVRIGDLIYRDNYKMLRDGSQKKI